MAIIDAYYKVDIQNLDLNFYIRNYYDDFFYDNQYLTIFDVPYQDIVDINGYDDPVDLGLTFGGSNITFNSSGAVTGGTVNVVTEYFWGGDAIWLAQGVSIPAPTLYAALLTASSADDYNMMAAALSGNDAVYLSNYDDRWNGFGGNDFLYGYEGDDTLYGAAGNDVLLGGLGKDLIDGGAGNDSMTGGDGNDVYTVDSTGDVVSETNADAVTGGVDRVNFTLAAYTLGANIEEGRILSGAVANLTGNALDNTLIAGAGNNVLNGGAGSDTASYSTASGAVRVSLAIAAAQATGASGSDRLVSIENLAGSSFNDTLTGNGGANKLTGNAGNDTLDGGAGDDTLTGGDGSDLYTVDSVGDVVSETNASLATGGTDRVNSLLATYALTSNVEDGRILSAGGADLTGNTLANTLFAGAGNNVLDGGGGSDTASYIYAGTGVAVSLAVAGAQATGGSGSETLVSIENLTGSAYNDVLTGDGGANKLTGNAGNDTLDGGAGDDTMTGGDGNDVYTVDSAGDVVSETNAVAATGGIDRVNSLLAAYTLGANIEEGRILSAGAANVTGNTLANTLFAGAGNNVLDGGVGADTASYSFAGGAVTVSLASVGAQATGNSGSDTLLNIENLMGSAYNDVLTGNTGANRLGGGAGNDTLIGGGGNDTMVGGDGSDLYTVDSVGDVVSESNAAAVTGGIDRVNSLLAAYTLGANVEEGQILANGAANLTGNGLANTLIAGAGNNVLNGLAGSDTVSYETASGAVKVNLAITTAQATGASGSDTLLNIEHLAGSSFSDTLTGNAGANRLSGGAGNDALNGGAGNDTMTGGDGNDLYTVDSAGDVVSETNADAVTGGIDRVNSLLAGYTLGANVEEGRILSVGSANLTGNALDNTLFAGVGNNVLNGDSGSDTASYATASGAVKVNLAITTAQATGASGSDTLLNIENLNGSSYNDTLTGNADANRLNGGAGNDTLNGGAGNDSLSGGAGTDFLFGGDDDDTFVFNTALGPTNIDKIQAFDVGHDHIQLENAVFSGITSTGVLDDAAFAVGAAATTADHRILYDSTTGAVLYDADGVGGTGPVQFATLISPIGTISADSFDII
ncbi:hypothetical protein L0V05_17745 [Tabrizicola sp. J26]|uniref:beta strand repeat-containing protein n=1 Tax=Alitabrizicola rongguiensis TaxID=2909234 RepID=UPI001F233EF7|nr:calcium-binding protein [Tabrizicola rongguiensis]MCF1710655.1 hypothetical protein [Tabrizicola rongguiensis]